MIEQIDNPQPRVTDSVLFKLGVIAALVILLLIPSSWIQSLILEREGYQQIERGGIKTSWADTQLVQGPVLMLPYRKLVNETDSNKKVHSHEVIKMLYVLPQALQIKGSVKTERFKKGVYDATGYNSDLAITGSFNKPDLAAAGIEPASVFYDKARLVFSLTDMKGLKNNPVINIQGENYPVEPTKEETIPFNEGLQTTFSLHAEQGFTFSYKLNLNGSDELRFLHTGRSTDVEISSDWKSPGFGNTLPDDSVINDKGFTAKWHMTYYARPFPQQWVNNNYVLLKKKDADAATFGVKLQSPIDQYRKILRATKYSTLIILLTFVSLFLTELIKQQRVHVFNYILIGAAMVVYYTLLLSFAEQVGFNLSYLISSVATIALIAAFTASLLSNKTVAITFSFILSVFYGFIFIIIQLEELSLLFGSIALFIIVAAMMYFSRKINWDKH